MTPSDSSMRPAALNSSVRPVYLDRDQREAVRWALKSAQKTLRNLAGIQVPGGKPERATVRSVLEELGDE
jgi:hypothetical protein